MHCYHSDGDWISLELFTTEQNTRASRVFQPSPLILYEVCPEGIQPHTMKNGDIYWRRYKIQETLYIGQWHLSHLPIRHLGTSHRFPNRYQLPHHIFFWISLTVWNLFPFKGNFSLGKARSHRAPNLGYRGLSHLGDLMFHQKTLQETWCMSRRVVVMKLPIAVAFWIIWIVSPEECSNLMQNLMQILCSTHSVILNVTGTQYICSLSGIYCSHWLVQWVVIVHKCTFQSTLHGCQPSSIPCKLFSLY